MYEVVVDGLATGVKVLEFASEPAGLHEKELPVVVPVRGVLLP